MSEFSKIWDNEVKELAKACVADPKIVQIIGKAEMGQEPTKEEKEYLNEESKKYHDIYGMYNISHLIWQVEHDLADNRGWKAKLAISQVYSVLNGPTYFSDVFEGDSSSEEWKTRENLRDGLKKLLESDDD